PGTWSDAATTLVLRVPPHVYETRWFLLTGILLMVLAAGTAYRQRVRRHERREADLEAAVRLRTHEVEHQGQRLTQQADELKAIDVAKSRFFANVSHEFRTPLALSIGPIQDLLAGRYGTLGGLRPRLEGVLLNN